LVITFSNLVCGYQYFGKNVPEGYGILFRLSVDINSGIHGIITHNNNKKFFTAPKTKNDSEPVTFLMAVHPSKYWYAHTSLHGVIKVVALHVRKAYRRSRIITPLITNICPR
jgi:hypothetical protein